MIDQPTIPWIPITDERKPIPWDAILIYGALEGENEPDAHEGYFYKGEWHSIRSTEILWRTEDGSSDPFVRNLEITEVTHWSPRPAAPPPP